jgi:hypothetical protein
MRAEAGDDPEKEYSGLQICDDFNATGVRLIQDQMVSIMIIVINMVLALVVVWGVRSIGFKTRSRVFSRTSILIMALTLFNTAMVVTLGNGNLSIAVPWLGRWLNGKYYDYSCDWYVDIGEILVLSLIINIFIPPIEVLVESILTWKDESEDKGRHCCNRKSYHEFKTKQSKLWAYMDVHGGPDQEVYVKYAELQTVFLTVIWYGPGMPILYPIMLVSYSVYWITTRFHFVYKIKKPPVMNDELVQTNIFWLKWAPTVMMANAWWIFTNKQVFEGWVEVRRTTDHQMKTGHTIWTSLAVN